LEKYKKDLIEGKDTSKPETKSTEHRKEKVKKEENSEEQEAPKTEKSEKIVPDAALIKEKQLSSKILKCNSIEEAYKLYDHNVLRMKYHK
jgi:hypothetical protein